MDSLNAREHASTLIAFMLSCALALISTNEMRADNGAPLMVPTKYGIVKGFVDSAKRSFLGIPFAAPPTGNLRWRPPVAPASWPGVFSAMKFGNQCPQWSNPPHWNWNNTHNRGFPVQFGGKTILIGDEDCLNLNVYTPLNATPGSNLPVLVYLFPGGDQIGDNREDFTAYANAGLVVVVPNYRLGVFGWIGLPSIVFQDEGLTSPNFGLYDQVAALQWIRDNIAAFGGDPNNVTLTGASAGSIDTAAQLTNPLAQGLFQKAIVASTYVPSYQLFDSMLFGATTTTLLGCDQAPDVGSCLRSKSFEEVDAAYNQVASNSPTGFFFQPVVDGITFPSQAWDYAKEHGTVPMIIGHNSEEAIFFNGGINPNATIQDVADNFYNLAPALYYPYPSQNDFVAYLSLYPLPGQVRPVPLRPAYADAVHDIGALWTDMFTGCATHMLADGAALQTGANPVFRYVMTREQASPGFPFPAASHMLQDYYVTGFLNWGGMNGFGWSLDPLTPDMYLLSSQMTQYWANFARTGDPNGPGLPTWPRYSVDSGTYIQFDTPITTGSHFRDAECAFLDRFIKEYVQMPSWAATGTIPNANLLQIGVCGIGNGFPECSTAGYVGP